MNKMPLKKQKRSRRDFLSAGGLGLVTGILSWPRELLAHVPFAFFKKSKPATGNLPLISGGFIAAARFSNTSGFSSDGTSWTSGTLPTVTNLPNPTSVVWNGSLFCAVAGEGNYWTSSDGVTWTTRSVPAGHNFSKISVGGTRFVAYSSTTVANSTDGITWTAGTFSKFYIDMAWNGTLFCVSRASVGADGTTYWCATSPTGVTWTERQVDASSTGFGSYCISSGTTFILSGGGTTLYTSTNGTAWTARSFSGSVSATDLASLNARVLAIEPFQSGASLSTNNGTTWANVTLPVAPSNPCSLVSMGTTAFAYIPDAGTSGTTMYTSTTGNTGSWTARTLPSSQTWLKGASNGTTFFLMSGTASIASAPVAAQTPWSAGTLPSGSGSGDWISAAWNGTVYCAIAANSNGAATSPDGTTWTARTLPSSGNWCAIAWNGSVFCAVRSDAAVSATSPDGITWTARTPPHSYYDVISFGTKFVAFGKSPPSSSYAATSTDGITWSETTIASVLKKLVSNGTTIVNADGSNSYTSLDGSTWTNKGFTFASAKYAIANASTFVAVQTSSSSTCTKASDGYSWSWSILPSTQIWTSVAWNGTVFCAISSGGTVAATSPDGTTWTARTLNANQNWSMIRS